MRRQCELLGVTRSTAYYAPRQPDEANVERKSEDYKQLLREHRIRQSMDGKSRWADNIMIERWFRSLKTECIYINEFRSPRELRRGIAVYIETYNSIRPHAALDHQTPEQVYSSCFEAAASPSAGLDRMPLAC